MFGHRLDEDLRSPIVVPRSMDLCPTYGLIQGLVLELIVSPILNAVVARGLQDAERRRMKSFGGPSDFSSLVHV